MNYFLLIIAAFAIALSIGPYLRTRFLLAYARLVRQQRRVLKKWTLVLGRYFLRINGQLEIASLPDACKETDNNKSEQFVRTLPVLGTLTPIRDASNITLYDSELVSKLADPDVKNIAITGTYGSGKSSIIKTFFYRHPEYNPLYVSLAAFKDDRKLKTLKHDGDIESDGQLDKPQDLEDEIESITPEQQKLLDDRIEYSILQQLFYHVRGKDVPFSRLKRIRTVKKSKIAGLALLVTLYAICILFTYVPSWLPGYNLWKGKLPDDPWLEFIAMAAVLTGAIYLVYLLFKFHQNASMIKLNLDRAELEIAPDKGSSVLNQHMDEIVYYFGATRHDLLIIEDLDRFKNPEIFVKLREINTLINNSLQINRKVTFIYALRDDVFVDESRTKFFDFIMPVVPVTNASNSAADLINMFDSLGLEHPVSHNFLNDLALFITDRRLIQNIFNEFNVYRNLLKNSSLNNDMLLGMIVYKNMHPTDFSHLQSNRGMVYEFLQRKQQIIDAMVKEKEEELIMVEREEDRIQRQHLKSIRELRLVYLGSLFEAIYREQGGAFRGEIRVGGNFYGFADLLADNIFEDLMTEAPIRLSSTVNARYSKVFGDIERDVDANQTYNQRLLLLNQSNQRTLDDLREKIQGFYSEIRQLKGQSIRDILVNRKLSTFKTPINQHAALSYLVGNGYISEDYWFYISYFQPGQLSEEDFQFIVSIKNRKNMKWEHRLTKVGQVITRLNDADCSLSEVLNYDLLAFLLDNNRLYEGKLAAVIGQLSALTNTSWIFIEGFRENHHLSIGKLVKVMVKQSPAFWTFIKRSSHNNPSLLRIYLELIIEHGDTISLPAMDSNREFSKDVSASSFLMESKAEHLFVQLSDILKPLDIKFQQPPAGEWRAENPLLKYIFEHYHYALNKEMVDFMLGIFHGEGDHIMLAEGQLTYSLTHGIAYFSDYIQANLDSYVQGVFLQRQTHTKESQDTWVMLMTSPDITAVVRKQIVEQASFQIEALDEALPEIYDQLVAFGRVKPTWYNLQVYKDYKQVPGVHTELISFVNNTEVYTELAKDMFNSYEPNAYQAFSIILIDLLQHEEVSTDCKVALLAVANSQLSFTSFRAVGNTVIKKMLALDIIAPDTEPLNALKEVNFPAFVDVLKKHWDKTSLLLEKLTLDQKQYGMLLSNYYFSPEEVLMIYESMTKNIMLGMLKNNNRVPQKVLELDKFALTRDEFNSLAGQLRQADTVVGLMKIYAAWLDEPLTIKFLTPLGGAFSRIISRKGKEVPNSQTMNDLLEVLQGANLLIEKYDVKVQVIQVTYNNGIDDKTGN